MKKHRKMKRILLVNDDGIESPGIKAAAEALNELDFEKEIIAVAPDKQQSGVGRSLTLRKPLEVKKVEIFDNLEAYSVKGTPVDCVIVALYSLLKEKPDLLVSGINLGENMSSEITTSGTVCAAIEGANHSVPGIAISLHVDEKNKFRKGIEHDFTLSKKVLREISRSILEHGLPRNVDFLNINVPDNKVDNCRVRITKLAKRMYEARVEKKMLENGKIGYLIDGDAIFDAEKGSDVYAVRVEKNISVTPLKIDLTSHEAIKEAERLYSGICF